MTEPEAIEAAARLVAQAEGLLITAGAGMGVDAGLPDFRGPQGFWRAYPALGKAGIPFERIASPDAFERAPRLAWGFYGHRLNLYRLTQPHEGHAVLLKWARTRRHGASVFTSNVDGLFQRAGFDPERIVECHGSIHHLQCAAACSEAIWEAADLRPEVDEERCQLLSDLPRCPACGALARPNILMFGDGDWVSARTDRQSERLSAWYRQAAGLLVIEVGAGVHVPSVRRFGESVRAPLVRINPTEAWVAPGRGVGLALGARAALQAIDAALG